MSGLIRTRPSPDRVVPAPATGGSRHRGAERWGPACGAAVPPAATRGSTVPAWPAPPPSSPNLRPPPSPSPCSAPLSPARPRSARAPLRCLGSRSPGIRPAAPSPGAMGAPPGYRPSAWVHLLHQLPRADFQLRPVPSGFAPQEREYQQVGAGAGVLGAGARRVGRAEGSRGRRGLGGRVLCSPQVGAGPGLRGI